MPRNTSKQLIKSCMILLMISIIIFTGINFNVDDVYAETTTKTDTTTTVSYNYTGSIQTFTAPYDGTYTFKCYGGSSLKSNSVGYSTGTIYLKEGTTLYISIGAYNVSSTADEATYLYITSGSTTTKVVIAGGGGYSKPNYHQHTGSSTSGGGCYTKENISYGGHSWYDAGDYHHNSYTGGNDTCLRCSNCHNEACEVSGDECSENKIVTYDRGCNKKEGVDIDSYTNIAYNGPASTVLSSYKYNGKTYTITGTASTGTNSGEGYATITYYNQFTNTLNYDANNGTNAPASQTMKVVYPNTQSTFTVATTPVPTRTGYIFDGWYTAASGGNKVGTTYTVGNKNNAGDQSATIYAHWTPITYTVYLHPNRPDSTKRSNDTEKSISAEHNVSYKTVSGWTLDSSTGIYSKTFTYDSTELETPGTFYSLTGWHFDNNSRWYKAQSSSNDGSASGDYYTAKCKNLTTTNNATIHLYPYWVKNTYKIKYDSNKGTTNIFGGTYTNDPTGSTSSTTCYYDTDITLATNGFSRVGYKFIGWSPNPNWGNGQTESTLTGVSSWDTKKATIKSLDYYTKLDESTTSSAIYVEGQKFFKQNLKTTNGTDTITLYAIWEPIRYTVTLHNNRPTDTTRGDANNDGSTDVGEHSVINNQSNGWNGWSLNSTTGNYTKTFIYDTTVLNSPGTFYSLTGWHFDNDSRWYKAQSSSNDGSANGGYYTATCKNLTTTNNDTINLYPYWVKNSYTITYNSNTKSTTKYNIFGDECTTDPTGTVSDISYYYDTDVTLATNGYTREGYIFVGWSTNPNWGYKQTDQTDWNTKRDSVKTGSDKFNSYTTTTDVSQNSLQLYTSGAELFKPNFTSADNGSITLYAIWEPITYKIVFNGNHNTNTSITMLDMTNIRFDQTKTLTANAYERKYTVTFEQSEPWLGKGNGNTKIQTAEYKFAGWNQATTQSASKLGSSPYYEVNGSPSISTGIGAKSSNYQVTKYVSNTDNGLLKDKATIKNLTSTNGATIYLSAAWNSATVTIPSEMKKLSGQGSYVNIGWSTNKYTDTRVHDKAIYNQFNTDEKISRDDVKAAITMGQPYTPYKDITLYAHWSKTVTLTFNTKANGGKYQYSDSDVVLTGTFYDYEKGYTFNILSGLTTQSKGKYDTQLNKIDAYGKYDRDGYNTKYTKIDSNSTQYRFLGWNLNSASKTPSEDFSITNSSHKTTYNITDNTTLYAIWEPVLNVNFSLTRNLGTLKFKNGTTPLSSITNVTAQTKYPAVEAIIRPGEQGVYSITTSVNNLDTTIKFHPEITRIYTIKGKWNDKLNPSTGWYNASDKSNTAKAYEDLIDNQAHGLSKKFTSLQKGIHTFKFYMPQYLGTAQTYPGNAGQATYYAAFIIKQSSYFYKQLYGTDEKIRITGIFYLTDEVPESEMYEECNDDKGPDGLPPGDKSPEAQEGKDGDPGDDDYYVGDWGDDDPTDPGNNGDEGGTPTPTPPSPTDPEKPDGGGGETTPTPDDSINSILKEFKTTIQ